MTEQASHPQGIPEETITQLREGCLQAVSRAGLFKDLSPNHIAALFPACILEDYQDEEIICRCPAAIAHHDAFLVLDGRVALKFRSGAEEHVLDLAGFGTVFNFEGLLGIEKQDMGARALGHTELLMIDVEKLLGVFSNDQAAGYVVIRNLAKLAVEQHRALSWPLRGLSVACLWLH